MYKLVASMVLGVILLAPVSASAAFQASDDYMLKRGQAVRDDLYVAGGVVQIDGDVRGDLIAAGGELHINGVISQDMIMAGGEIVFKGGVRDDMRVVGGELNLGGSVTDDLIVAGGEVTLTSTGYVGGDATVAGGKVVLEGRVQGDVRASGGEIFINGPVNGNVNLMADRITIGPKAVIIGNLTYRSHRQASIEPGAQIRGDIDYQRARNVTLLGEKTLIVFGVIALGVWVIVKLLMTLSMAILAVVIFKKSAPRIVNDALKRFPRIMLPGLGVLVLIPLLAILLGITIIGLPAAVVVGLGYIAIMILASAFMPVILGSWVMKLWTKQSTPEVSVRSAIIGTIVYCLLMIVPVIGGLVKLMLCLTALGAVGSLWYHDHWKNR